MSPAELAKFTSLSADLRQSAHWWRCQRGNTHEMDAHRAKAEGFMLSAGKLDALLLRMVVSE